MKKMNETKVVCPQCGAQFAIAEKTHIAAGVVIGKDAGLGTIHPEVVGQDKPEEKKLPKKASERIEALRDAGVDVSNFFAMSGPDGGEYVGKAEGGKFSILGDNDPIYDAILEGGDVYNWKLARRWVMGQMFDMFAREGDKKFGEYDNSITAQIRRKGYDYMWKQLEDELYAQWKMKQNGDKENFEDRNRWFNADLVVKMLEDYRNQLHLHVKHHLKTKKCKGRPYKCVCGENIYEFDIQQKVFEPIEKLKKQAQSSSHVSQLYNVVEFFNRKIRRTRSWNPKQCAAWIDAYKGAGAFFTMQNLIRYHKCRFSIETGSKMSKNDSYLTLKGLANDYTGKGWRLIGVLRQFLKDNNIDIEAKRAEWRKL